jgi:uncharacterized protein YndB with AHSA1/START domain
METITKTRVVKNFQEHSVLISRAFDAPIEKVWQAFTDKEMLDQWWAPQPWRAETKAMDFRIGGYWLYAMVGPDNEKHWGRMNFTSIDKHESFNIEDAFCDENGEINYDLPVAKGQIAFVKTRSGTRVDFKTQYPTEADVEKIVEMGFEEGITATFEQLDKLLKNENS